jgi:hypothetical protein
VVKPAPIKLTAPFIGGSRRRFEDGGDRAHGGATAMKNPTVPQKSQPSLWAVGLFLLSTGFALTSIVLVSMDYSPL